MAVPSGLRPTAPSPKVWLDASDSSTITDSGGTVSAWACKQGTFTFTASGNPTINTTTQNSLATMDFDGTLDKFVCDQAASNFTFLHAPTGNPTIFIVFKPGNVADPDTLYALLSTGGASDTYRGHDIWWDDRSSVTRNNGIMSFVTKASGGNQVISNLNLNQVTPNAYHVIGVRNDNDNGTAADRSEIFVDGDTALKSSTVSASASTSDASATLTVGNFGTNADYPLTGQIAEILVYEESLTDDERQEIEGYLAHKWGTTLASGHPWENQAPNWSHSATVTIPSNAPDASLTDYPAYVDLSHLTPAFWSTVANGGGDIRVFNSDGTVELPREVVSCSTGYLTLDGVDDSVTVPALTLNSGDIVTFYFSDWDSSGTAAQYFMDGTGTRPYLYVQGTTNHIDWNTSTISGCTLNGSSVTRAADDVPTDSAVNVLVATISATCTLDTLHARYTDEDYAPTKMHRVTVERSGALIRDWNPRAVNTGTTVTDDTGNSDGTITGGATTSGASGELHVLTDLSVISDTQLRVYADGVSSDYATDATYGAEAVWAYYAAVYHGEGDPSSTLTDSTGNYDAATTGMTSADEVDGQLGSGFNVSASKYATATAAVANGYPYTLQGWIYRDAVTGNVFATAVGDKDVTTYFSAIYASPDNDVKAAHHQYGSGSFVSSGSATSDTQGEWYSMSGVYADNSIIAYHNAVAATEQTGTTGDARAHDEIWIGYLGDDSETYNTDSGRLDELRIRESLLSADWISTEYTNQATPTTFYTVTDQGAGGSGVYADFAVSYSIRELLSVDTQLLYQVAEILSSDFQAPYSILSLAAADAQLLAHIREAVSGDAQLLYDIISLGAVGVNLQLLANISETVSADAALPAHILELVSADAQLLSKIRELAGSNLQVLYDVIQDSIAGASLQLPSNISEHLASDFSLPSHILTAVAEDVELTYRVLELATADMQTPYSMRELATADLAVRYNLLADVVLRDLKKKGGLALVQLLQQGNMSEDVQMLTLIESDQSTH